MNSMFVNNQQPKPEWKFAKLAWMVPLIGIILLFFLLLLFFGGAGSGQSTTIDNVILIIWYMILAAFPCTGIFIILCFILKNKYKNTVKQGMTGLLVLLIFSFLWKGADMFIRRAFSTGTIKDATKYLKPTQGDNP